MKSTTKKGSKLLSMQLQRALELLTLTKDWKKHESSMGREVEPKKMQRVFWLL